MDRKITNLKTLADGTKIVKEELINPFRTAEKYITIRPSESIHGVTLQQDQPGGQVKLGWYSTTTSIDEAELLHALMSLAIKLAKKMEQK